MTPVEQVADLIGWISTTANKANRTQRAVRDLAAENLSLKRQLAERDATITALYRQLEAHDGNRDE